MKATVVRVNRELYRVHADGALAGFVENTGKGWQWQPAIFTNGGDYAETGFDCRGPTYTSAQKALERARESVEGSAR